METTGMTLAALAVLTAAGYAHLRIAAHTTGAAKVLLTRLVLVAVGVGLGVTAAAYYPENRTRAVLAFLVGLGLAHVPAAIILFIKTRRGEGRS